ncbi:hypothetical protein [Duganella radicis]|uniref:Polymerase nucleotidyl transferase domain-containing protein n=1 Tax=Duganella radicis TaxID=551988 RepID=A0A6L6PG41_9BURK|nr:hypothetical protein [Duganella radicis]MTV38046.1 hypothetical protein [Duganella radicis]
MAELYVSSPTTHILPLHLSAPMTFVDILENHTSSQDRRATSLERLEMVRSAFSKEPLFKKNKKICVFAAGSLGRLDSGVTSDLDVFVTTTGGDVGRLREIEVFSSIIKVNEALQFPALSNDGQFLKVFDIPGHEKKVGSAKDDNLNWFTTRMLFLLESNYLCNEKAYHQHKTRILKLYFRDSTQDGFRPIFLLNDILRYWRTVCLNYEQARSIPGKSWKKRNFNLKFSRLLSVFGTILPLMLTENVTTEKIEELSSIRPMDRLAMGLDLLKGADDLKPRFLDFLENYEHFLKIKESMDFESVTDEIRNDLKSKAILVAEFINDAVTHASVPKEFRRYLII